MRKLVRIITWLGIGIMIIGIPFSFAASSKVMSGAGTEVEGGALMAWLLGAVGIIPMLIGGLIARPKYFWIGCLIAGALYIVSFYGFLMLSVWTMANSEGRLWELIAGFAALLGPGLLALVEGILLKILPNRIIEE